jgi:hypothetical protein
LVVLAQVVGVLKTYYTQDFANKVKRPPWDFASNSPRMVSSSTGANDAAEEAGSVSSPTVDSSWSGLLYGSALGSVHAYAPWMEESASSFFTLKRGGPEVPSDAFTLGNLVHDFTRCSFDNVMFCGRENADGTGRVRRNIVVCGVISVAGWAVVAWFVSTLPFVGSGLGTFVFASMLALVPITALQLAYGMAYTCFPMLPTCLIQDLVYSLQALLPMNLKWPDALQTRCACVCVLIRCVYLYCACVCVLIRCVYLYCVRE